MSPDEKEQPEVESGFALVEPDEGVRTDDEPDAVAVADTTVAREDVLAPEEAALHVVDEDDL